MRGELCSPACPSLVQGVAQHGVSMACPWAVDGEVTASTGLALRVLPVSLVDRWPHMWAGREHSTACPPALSAPSLVLD